MSYTRVKKKLVFQKYLNKSALNNLFYEFILQGTHNIEYKNISTYMKYLDRSHIIFRYYIVYSIYYITDK